MDVEIHKIPTKLDYEFPTIDHEIVSTKRRNFRNVQLSRWFSHKHQHKHVMFQRIQASLKWWAIAQLFPVFMAVARREKASKPESVLCTIDR